MISEYLRCIKKSPGFCTIALLIFIVALLLRGGIVWKFTPMYLTGDEPEYTALAVTMLENHSFSTLEMNPSLFQCGKEGEPTAYRSPVFPFFLAVHFQLFGYSLTPPRITLIILSAIICLFLAFTGRIAGQPASGLIAAALWAIDPPSVIGSYASDRFYPETLSIFFLTGAVLLISVFLNHPKIVFAILAGILLGLAILSRGYLLFVLPMVVIYLYLYLEEKKWKLLTAFMITSSVIIGGWVFRNYTVMGKMMLSTQTEHFYLGNNSWARGSFYGDFFKTGYDAPQLKRVIDKYPGFLLMSEVQCSEIWSKEALQVIKENPGHFVWLMFRKTIVFWGPFQYWSRGFYKYHYFFIAILLFAALELMSKWKVENIRYYILLLIPITAVFMSALITYGFDRYRYVIEPFIFLLGGMGIQRMIRNTRWMPITARWTSEKPK